MCLFLIFCRQCLNNNTLYLLSFFLVIQKCVTLGCFTEWTIQHCMCRPTRVSMTSNCRWTREFYARTCPVLLQHSTTWSHNCKTFPLFHKVNSNIFDSNYYFSTVVKKLAKKLYTWRFIKFSGRKGYILV